MRIRHNLIPLIMCVVILFISLSCSMGASGPKILLEKEVTVPGGGNTAEVVFSAEEGQRIRISLVAMDQPVEPYGYLTFPDGSGDYIPHIDNIQGGKNSAELTIKQSGAFTLAIMDGSNQGGRVKVKVEVLE